MSFEALASGQPAPELLWIVICVGVAAGLACLCVGVGVGLTLVARQRTRPPDSHPEGVEALAAANQKLRAEIGNRLIAESELKLHARELEKARDEAEAANRAKAEFLANMSHEMRTPLNAVIGISEHLITTNVSDEQREHLRTVLDSGHQLLGVISDILDFARIEAGKVRIERRRFHLEDAVGDTLRSFGTRTAQKAIELVCCIGADVPRVLVGDPVRLRQVITNLVSNAVAFTERGEVVVRVEREASVAPQVRLRFGVEDTGVGIDPAQIERLFGAFEQADASSRRSHGGTGLGLSICRGLVELLGGEIGATSAPGRGSHFHFTACFEAAADPEPAERPTLRNGGGSEQRSQQPPRPLEPDAAGEGPGALRILLCEDSLPNQKVARAILEGWGHSVCVAGDGEEALGVYGSRRFDVVLMDVQMPRMDGFACTAAIRAAEMLSGEHVPIVAMTAHALTEDREKCLDSGMDDYVSKPIQREQLLRALTEAARGRAG